MTQYDTVYIIYGYEVMNKQMHTRCTSLPMRAHNIGMVIQLHRSLISISMKFHVIRSLQHLNDTYDALFALIILFQY